MSLKVVLPVVVVILTVFATVTLVATGSRLNPVQPEATQTEDAACQGCQAALSKIGVSSPFDNFAGLG